MTSENFHDGFYSIVDISDFTEFPYTALVLLWVSVVLFCYFSFCFVFLFTCLFALSFFPNVLLSYFILLMYVCSGPVRDLLKFYSDYINITAISGISLKQKHSEDFSNRVLLIPYR